MPNTAISSRDFYLIVKEKDNKGNLKIDYKINKIKIQEEEKTYKTIPIVGGIEKFFKRRP